MKTRTNQPIELANTQDIEHLSDSFLNELKAGDIITKQTGNQKHRYVVSYKEEKHGICLTYVDCGYMETISYDYTNGHWVFNSKDVVETQEKLVSGTNIKTIGGQSILGSGNLAVSGGTQLYCHNLLLNTSLGVKIITNHQETIDTLDKLKALCANNQDVNSNEKIVCAYMGGYLCSLNYSNGPGTLYCYYIGQTGQDTYGVSRVQITAVANTYATNTL